MPIDHSSCDHERTPKARAACRRAKGSTPVKQRAERPVEATKARHTTNDTRAPRWRATDTLKALCDAPARVRDFVNRCGEQGWEITPVPVEVGHSLEVHSSRGAGRVTWEGERTAWFTRLGYTSITTRVSNCREVWKVLRGGTDDE